MRRHDRSISRIITAKADFLISLQSNCGVRIGERMDEFAKREKEIDAMPYKTGWVKKRQQKVDAYDRLDAERDKFLAHVGSSVVSTYSFVQRNKARLSPGVRRLLLGKVTK